MTTDAGADMVGIHDRMPVIIEGADRDRWLDPDIHEADAVTGLLVPARAGVLVRYPISTEVNNVRNDGPRLIVEDKEVDLGFLTAATESTA